ncbi:MAG: ABC transporter permease [Ardenticatenaceae bacterium]
MNTRQRSEQRQRFFGNWFDRFIEPGSTVWYFSRDRLAMICFIFLLIVILAALFAPLLTSYPEQGLGVPNITEKFQPPSSTYPLGTDSLGRDLWARILYGARTSLFVGFSIVILGGIIGVASGAIAGYFGGWTDEMIMRITDIFLSFPPLLFAITVAAVLEPSIGNTIIAITLVWWPWYTRIVRAQVISVREQNYVRAARAIGVGDFTIIWRHIIPNVMGPVLVQATLDLGAAILTAAALSFLGLGTEPPTADWGVMVDEGRQHLLSGRWWLAIFPGLALFLTAMALNLVGDGIRDAADPKTRGV